MPITGALYNDGYDGDAMLYPSWSGVDFYIYTENSLLSWSIRSLLADIHLRLGPGTVGMDITETRNAGDIVTRMVSKKNPAIVIVDYDAVFFAEKIRFTERFNHIGCFHRTIVLCNEAEYASFGGLYHALFDVVIRKKDVVASYHACFNRELNSLLYYESILNAGAGTEHFRHRFFTLTPREGDILRKIMSGMSNTAIAEELYISIKTVSTHRSNIYEKFNVRTLTELYNLLLRESLIDTNFINLSMQSNLV